MRFSSSVTFDTFDTIDTMATTFAAYHLDTYEERRAVSELYRGNNIIRLSTPDEKTLAVLAKAGVIFEEKVDHVLTAFKVPDGWTLVPNSGDAHHSKLKNAEGVVIATVFLKSCSL